MEIPELTQGQAFALLDEWREVTTDRARRVRIAQAAGISKSAIARRMDLARSTVYADLAEPGSAADTSEVIAGLRAELAGAGQ